MVPSQGGDLFNISTFEDSVELKIFNITDESVANDLVSGAGFIFNLAGSSSHVNSMLEPQSDLELNCEAQLNFLEACRKSNPHVKIVFSSTRQVYGRPDHDAHYLPRSQTLI
jgi:UDP-glucose 4-epimerase